VTCPQCPHDQHQGWCASCKCYSHGRSSFDYNPAAHARGSDPDTSRDAAAQVTTLNGHCEALLRVYPDWVGLTAEEAAGHAGINPWAASKRVSDLRRMGLIEPLVLDGKTVTRKNSSNRQAEVCCITVAGRNKLKELM
jgi:hypothetical protein